MKKSTRFTLILFLFLPLLNSCGVWSDFTTYFNLYYNTSNLFEETENKIFETKRGLFSTEPLDIPGAVNQNLVKIIEKSSRILQFHPNSSYVDDALLMLGKSFYYQKNYLKALRKFQELLATQQETDLNLETEFWIAKTELELKNYESALEILRQVREKAIAEDENEIVQQSYIEEIKYNLTQEDYSSAIQLASELLNYTGSRTSAEIYRELGLLYIKIKDYENAIVSFEKVFDYNPEYIIEYSATLELAKTLRLIDKNQEALAMLTEMRGEDKFSEEYHEIDLERGITLINLEFFYDAVNVLKEVDTSYTNKPSSAVARFKLAEIYEFGFSNFDSASVYYTKAASSAQIPQEYLKAANDKASLFKKYETLIIDLARNRKQYLYAINPEEFIKDSTAFYDTISTVTEDQNEQLIQDDEIDLIEGRGRNRNFTSVSQQNQVAVNKPPQRPVISADSLEMLIAKNLFDLGNIFLTDLDIPDSAYYYYNFLLTNYPNTDYEARTLYAIGNYYEIIDDNVKADSIFNLIYENFRGESVVNAAASKTGKPLIDLEYDPAKELYANAEREMLNNKFESSLKSFLNISEKYPSSPYAPKALYSSGWILENEMKLYDSAAVVYDSITARYPQSQYASAVRPKLTSYKEEKERIKKAIEDSLMKIEQKKLDSLAVADSINQRLSTGTVSSDTTRMFEQLSDSSNTTPIDEPEMRNYIEEGNRQKRDFPPDNRLDEESNDLKMEHQTNIDSLRRNREVDSLYINSDQQDTDTLNNQAPRNIR